ncbi:MAG: ribonuclease P protein component [Planctomycetaceae bacterium]
MSGPSPSTDETSADSQRRSLRYRKAQHLRRPAEFQRVYDGKVRAGDDRLLVFALRNELGLTRIGLSVSRKHGGSVQRQRLKRLLREAFRLSQHDLPSGLDLILIPRPQEDANVVVLQHSLMRLAKKLVKRLPFPTALAAANLPGDAAAGESP